MCAIVGILNRGGQPVRAEDLVRMRDEMIHRGPDDAGLHLEGPVGLGHRRLSILDLSPAGHQPMCNEDGTVWLVFNGEIYNYVELAAELRKRGHQFRSSSDSEVIIHLYEEFGEDCLAQMNGMFAFVLWDSRRQCLFGARDRIGIKPLYYRATPREFTFASEIKALLAGRDVSRAPDLCSVADYLYCGRSLAGRTLFAEICEVQPGWAFRVDRDQIRHWEYWRVPGREEDSSISEDDAIDALAALIEDSVRVECRSDAEVGCHLSGGLDSSTIACLTTRHRSAVKSFSIRSPGGAYYDETGFAKIVARHAGTEYLEADATHEDMDAMVAKLVWHMDAPMPVPGGINYYVLSRLAAKHVKVTLTGHGGDEVFGGYPAQFAVGVGSTAMFPQTAPTPASESLPHRVRTALAREGLRGLIRRLSARTQPLTPEDRWIQLHCSPAPESDPTLHPAFVAALAGYSPRENYLEAFSRAPSENLFDRCLHHDLRCYLPSLLHMEDRTSMANSVESRVPLLDHRIVEFIARLPARLRPDQPKKMFRASARRWLPKQISDRKDKAGFPLPVEQWFANELAGPSARVFHSRAMRERGIFAERDLMAPTFGRSRGWAALNLELWFRIFVDQRLDPATPLTRIE